MHINGAELIIRLLEQQGVRHVRTTCRDQDRVERLLLGQALGAVALQDADVPLFEPLEPLGREPA